MGKDISIGWFVGAATRATPLETRAIYLTNAQMLAIPRRISFAACVAEGNARKLPASPDESDELLQALYHFALADKLFKQAQDR